jgi:uncharacterized membrane protein
MFANLLRFVDPYVYKIFFQIIFAICPAVIYLLIRKWTAPIYAFAATMYFIAFPTFFNDMPMLNRQEIAFLFFTLMLYTAFQDEIKLRYRRWLFLLLSVGLVISHYSTTYSVVIILLSSAIFWPLIRKAGKKLQKLSIFKNSAYSAIQNSHGEIKRITISMVVIIFSLSFLWTTILTNTGGNTLRIIKETVIAATNGFKDDTAKSADTNYNIFSWQKLDAQKQLDTYVQKVVEPSRKSSPNIYYNQNTYSSFAIKPSDSNVMPQTQLGVFFSKHIMNVETFNFSVRQGSAKLIQILMLVGLIFLLFKRKYTNLVDTDLVALSIGAIIFLILQVVLPILSIEYGLLRAFQQSLIVLSLFVVMGSVALFKLIPKYGKKPLLSLLVAVAFLISSTGFVTQLLGGYYAQLNLNNSGTYYDIYYLHRSEVLGIKWLADNVSRTNINGDEVQAEVQTDRYSFSKVNSISDVSAINDIYPGLIRKDSYVYLGFSNVNKEQATISYTGNLLTYTYPVQFLDNNKDLIYNNGSARIYR